jgi:hypothetical protein
MDRVYIVTVDDVKVGTFSTYDKAMDFIQDCRTVKPYAQYGIEEVPVDTAIVRRVYRVDFDANGNVNKSSHVIMFDNWADARERGVGLWRDIFGGVVSASLNGFDDAIVAETQAKEVAEVRAVSEAINKIMQPRVVYFTHS